MHEIQLNRKKYFFTVIYTSQSQDQSEFDNFTFNFELMLSKMHAENPFYVIIAHDFNCRSTKEGWENDIVNNEGKLFEPITTDTGLHQLISEPTHLIGDSKSCIDLIFTDQPSLRCDLYGEENFFLPRRGRTADYVKSGQPGDKLEGIKSMISEGAEMIEDAKQNYLRKTEQSLANPGTASKTYWSLTLLVLGDFLLTLY